MDGLQAILERILEEGRQQADQILERTRERTESQWQTVRDQGRQMLEDAKIETSDASRGRLNRARSLASMESRKSDLQIRQDLIDQVIEQAVERLTGANEPERIARYIEMLKTLDDGRMTGTVCFSETDQALAPQVLAPFGGRFSIDEKAGSFSGGLILRRGLIEDNLTYDLTVRNHRAQLVRTAARVLFESDAPLAEESKA